jgi:hypothetical protein
MDVAKKANQIIKDAIALMDESGAKYFENLPEIFNNASGMVNGNEKSEALLKGWMVSQASQAVFYLWRRNLMTEDIEKAFRELPLTEEAVADWEAFEKADQKVADDLEEKRREYMNGQHEIDIFKAVLNGIPKEQAEAKYNEYQQKIARAAGA